MQASISSSEPDWSREIPRQFWDPSRKLLAAIRCYQTYQHKNSFIYKGKVKFAILRHRFWSIITGADIPLNTNIGGGLLIPHPNGIVIHPQAEIGVNCLIFQQVTIGAKAGGIPKLAGHVDIGAGAKILGAIHLGEHVQIGANSVVLQNIPKHSVAVGIPAKIIQAQ